MYKLKDIFTLNLNSRGGVKLFNKIANRYNLNKEDRKDLMNVEVGGKENEYYVFTYQELYKDYFNGNVQYLTQTQLATMLDLSKTMGFNMYRYYSDKDMTGNVYFSILFETDAYDGLIFIKNKDYRGFDYRKKIINDEIISNIDVYCKSLKDYIKLVLNEPGVEELLGDVPDNMCTITQKEFDEFINNF